MHFKPTLISLVLLLAAGRSFAATRVALVSNGTDGVGQSVAFATAELTNDKDLELAERSSIRSVLEEQKLTLSGMVNGEQMIQIGKLLKADLFAVVDADPKNGQALGVVVFDSGSGVRLSDVALEADAERAGKTIAQAVRGAVAKDRGLGAGVRLIGFLPVRNADLPPDRDIIGDTAALLLERELTASPGLAVLERGRLEQVNKERQLPIKHGTGNLWPSLIVVQLEISRAGKQGLKASATLTDSSGKVLDRPDFTSKRESAAELADGLGESLAKSLQVQPIDQAANRGQEARRFAADCVLLNAAARHAAATAAGEAAYALRPDEDNRLILATALWMSAWEYLTPDNANGIQTTGFAQIQAPADTFGAALNCAERALALEQSSLKHELARHHSKDTGYLDLTGGEERFTYLEGYCSRVDAVRDVKPEYQSRLKDFRTAATTYLIDYFDGWAKWIPSNPTDLQYYNAEMLYATSTAAGIATSLAEFVTLRDRLFHQWIGCFDQHWPKGGELWMEAGGRQSQFMTALLDGEDASPDRWHDYSEAALAGGLGHIADDLNHSSNLVLQLYGTIAKAISDPAAAAASQEARNQARSAFSGQLKKTLKNPGPTPIRVRMYSYIAAADANRLLSTGTESMSDAAIDVMDLSVQHHQLMPLTALKMLWSQIDTSTPALRQKAGAALGRMTQLSHAEDVRVLDDNADGVAQEIFGELHQLSEASAAPAPHGDSGCAGKSEKAAAPTAPATPPAPAAGAEPAVKPWDAAKRLVDFKSLPGISRIEEGARVFGDMLDFLASGTDASGGFFIQAFEVPLAGGTPKALGKTSVSPLPEFGDKVYDTDLDYAYRLIQGSAVDERNFYVCVHDQGVVVFPRDGTVPTRINADHGLPSNWARSVVALDGLVYIAVSSKEGSYLVKWHVKKQTFDVRISTVRSEKKSPLDNTPGIWIQFIVADPERKRLLMGVTQRGTNIKGWEACRGGLWEVETGKNVVKRLLTSAAEVDVGSFRGIDHDALITANRIWVVQFELAQNKAKYLSFKPKEGVKDSYIKELPLKKETPRGSGWADGDMEEGAFRTVIDNWLWAGDPFRRISANGKTVELLDGKLAPDAQPIGPVWTMERAGDHRLVLGDIRQLYVVTLRGEN
jgi:hypothetical protein